MAAQPADQFTAAVAQLTVLVDAMTERFRTLGIAASAANNRDVIQAFVDLCKTHHEFMATLVTRDKAIGSFHDDYRVDMVALQFDLEATKRERAELQAEVARLKKRLGE